MADRTARRDIRYAAEGAAAIVRRARDEQDAGSLAYVAVYACGFAGRATDLDRYRDVARYRPDAAFVNRLRREVPGVVDMTGWTVTGRDGGRTLLEKDGIRAFVDARELSFPADVGDDVTFSQPLLRAGVMPGFVVRRGTSSPADRSNLSRLYLNTRPAAAAWVLGPLAERLEAARLPFEMKVMAHPRAYVRRDSSVLYVPSERDAEAAQIVGRAIVEAGRDLVRSPVPRLTERVAPGVGLAHEPTDITETGLSHGQWVAGLFRDAVRDATAPGAIAGRVRALIADAGRDPDRPHLRGEDQAS
jgi:hypothetical protein